MKEIKLSEAQEKAYNKILERLEYAKGCTSLKEYYLKDRGNSEWMWDKMTEEEKEFFTKCWLNAKDNNQVLTSAVSSATLRSLEKKGLIKIIRDGGRYVDEVEVIEAN